MQLVGRINYHLHSIHSKASVGIDRLKTDSDAFKVLGY